MSDFILACDEGTSSARSIVFDRSGNEITSVQLPLTSRFPHDGWVEQDAEEIWALQLATLTRATESIRGGLNNIEALGITNQRETTVVWDRGTGKPIAPAIVWQCRRTAAYCDSLRDLGYTDTISNETGLVLDAYFSASKIRWVLDHVPYMQERAEDGQLAFGTIDSWLIYNLTDHREHVIDRTNASRTMLMNLKTNTWSMPMLELFNIPEALLPRIVGSSEEVAYTSGDVLGAEIPIAGIAGDQQAALAGQQCSDLGSVKNTYGTGCFTLMHTGYEPCESTNGLLSTTAASLKSSKSEYALEGSVFTAGTALQWLRDRMKFISSAAESQELAASVPDTQGVYFVPAFVGLGAPHWNSKARGQITGISQSTSITHLVRATLESIAFQTRDLIVAMEKDSGTEITELRVDGGAAANDFLLQFQADILGIAVRRPKNLESTALGAAYLAGIARGFWEAHDQIQELDRTFEPSISEDKRSTLLEGWQSALNRVLSQ